MTRLVDDQVSTFFTTLNNFVLPALLKLERWWLRRGDRVQLITPDNMDSSIMGQSIQGRAGPVYTDPSYAE